MRLQLRDTVGLDGVAKTKDGYLTAFANVARTGVQQYKGYELNRPDLGDVAVYRPEKEVFSPAAMLPRTVFWAMVGNCVSAMFPPMELRVPATGALPVPTTTCPAVSVTPEVIVVGVPKIAT